MRGRRLPGRMWPWTTGCGPETAEVDGMAQARQAQHVDVVIHAVRGWFGAELLRGGKRIALSPPQRTEEAARVWAARFLEWRATH